MAAYRHVYDSFMSPAGWLPRTGITSGTIRHTLGNRVWATFTFFTVKMASPDTLHCPLLAVPNVIRCTNRHVAFWRAGISVPTVEVTFRLSVAPQTMNLFCHKARLCISIFLTYLMLLMCQCSGMISLKLHCNFIKTLFCIKKSFFQFKSKIHNFQLLFNCLSQV